MGWWTGLISGDAWWSQSLVLPLTSSSVTSDEVYTQVTTKLMSLYSAVKCGTPVSMPVTYFSPMPLRVSVTSDLNSLVPELHNVCTWTKAVNMSESYTECIHGEMSYISDALV